MSTKPLLLFLCVLLWSCGDQSPAITTLDEAGEQFVRLSLELGEYDEYYIDSYVGPGDWQQYAQEHVRSKESLLQATAKLLTIVEAIKARSGEEATRRRMLLGKVRAMDARARMINGEVFTFAEEAKLLLDADPVAADFDEFARVLAEIDSILPGEGDLNGRVDALRSTVVIPEEKLDVVFRKTIEECRKRTLDHIDLPEAESFRLEYVSGVSWGGYLEYLGDYESLMSINIDVPMTLDRAINLGCHEGYPGHHVYNLLVDQRYLQELNWIEFQLQPLFTPAMLIHEGSAEYAVELAFPGRESVVFQRDVLAPLAGIDPTNVEIWNDFVGLDSRVGDHAKSATAQRYFDGEITREEAVEERTKYGMVTPREAERNVLFAEDFGSYVLNYSLGEEIVSTYIDSQSNSEAEKWDEFKKLIEELPTASDLTRSQ
jgi:hypothetical protein